MKGCARINPQEMYGGRCRDRSPPLTERGAPIPSVRRQAGNLPGSDPTAVAQLTHRDGSSCLAESAQCAISSTCAGSNFPPRSKAGCTLSRSPFLLCLHLHRKIARFAAPLRLIVTLFRLGLPLATVAQRRNRWVKQNEVSARLARVKPDDRTTQRGECETFRLAIEIAEPPCFEEPSSPPPAESSSSRAIVEDLSLRR